jgi:hypothetical protein
VDQNGQLQRVLPQVSPEQPLATVENLVEQLRLGVASGAFRAVAILSAVNVHSPRGDATLTAIQVGLEHVDGYTADIYFPFELLDGQVRFHEPFGGKRQRTVFATV